MTCLFGCLGLFAPRITIFLLVLGGDYIGTAYESRLVPLVGFFVLPVTTLAYAWAVHAGGGEVGGPRLAVVVFAVLVNVGIVGSGHAAWRVQNKRAP